MKKTGEGQNNKKTPPLSWCEFLILKKALSENGELTPYRLSQYAEKLDECEKSYGTYNNMKRLLRQWEEGGLIELVKLHEDYKIHRVRVLSFGLDLLSRLDVWYGTPNS